MGARVPAFVINLDRRRDRLETISAHLDSMGVDFVRWPAVDGADGRNPAVADDLIAPGHAAAVVSHRQVWAAIADGPDEVALILEDDAVLDGEYAWSAVLPELAHGMVNADVGLLQLGFLSFGWRARLAYGASDLLTARARRLNRPGRTEGGLMRLTPSVDAIAGDFRMGTHCYLVQRRAARLLERLNRPAFRHCDVMLADVARLDPSRIGWRVARVRRSMAGQASEVNGRLQDSDTS